MPWTSIYGNFFKTQQKVLLDSLTRSSQTWPLSRARVGTACHLFLLGSTQGTHQVQETIWLKTPSLRNPVSLTASLAVQEESTHTQEPLCSVKPELGEPSEQIPVEMQLATRRHCTRSKTAQQQMIMT